MSRQRTLNDAIFWRSPEMAGRTQEDRAMLCYLLTSPFSNIVGVYRIVPRIAASEMGWDSDSQLLPVIQRLALSGFVRFDPELSFVWVRIWWDHNSARMAVGGTLRQRTFEQIEQMPRQWQQEYLKDFVGRLPLPSEDKLGLRTAVAARFAIEPSNEEQAPIPYGYPTDRGAGNPTTNDNTNSNTTTANSLRCPSSLPFQEVQAMCGALDGIPINDAQQLIDEVAGALNCNGIGFAPIFPDTASHLG